MAETKTFTEITGSVVPEAAFSKGDSKTEKKTEKKPESFFKIVDKDLRGFGGFQFEIGKTYEQSGDIVVCKNGFHCCAIPAHCYNFVDHMKPPLRYLEVVIPENSNITRVATKIAASKMTISREIPKDEWVKILSASIELEKEDLFLVGMIENSADLTKMGMDSVNSKTFFAMCEYAGYHGSQDSMTALLGAYPEDAGQILEMYLRGVHRASVSKVLSHVEQSFEKGDPREKKVIFGQIIRSAAKCGRFDVLDWCEENTDHFSDVFSSLARGNFTYAALRTHKDAHYWAHTCWS